MTDGAYCAIYDFQIMPYALGDVLTWNVLSAIRCEELGRESVETYICLDDRSPASIFQRDFATAANSSLLFNELFGAFGTHPKPGNVHFYRSRDKMLARLRELGAGEADSTSSIDDYERVLADRDEGSTLFRYFRDNVQSHDRINAFYAARGRIPLLRPSLGCEPDVESLLTKRFANHRIVAIHARMRRLDIGYGGNESYGRDSDFLEWYEFLRAAGEKYPDVQFVALGRTQEKPLELLNLPNVANLRAWGLGLGHELTLILRSDMFIGASSGFAAMAYFSTIPYAITRMTQGACKAYSIEFGATRMPFGTERQVLVYEPETKELLMRLLEEGLGGVPPRTGTRAPVVDPVIDVRSWDWERSQWLYPGATTTRFFADDTYGDKETAYLVWPRLREALAARGRGLGDRAWAILNRIEASFPRMSGSFPEFLRLRMVLAAGRKDALAVERCRARLRDLARQEREHFSLGRLKTRHLARAFPAVMRLKSRWNFLKYLWKRKHRIPPKLVSLLRRAPSRGHSS